MRSSTILQDLTWYYSTSLYLSLSVRESVSRLSLLSLLHLLLLLLFCLIFLSPLYDSLSFSPSGSTSPLHGPLTLRLFIPSWSPHPFIFTSSSGCSPLHGHPQAVHPFMVTLRLFTSSRSHPPHAVHPFIFHHTSLVFCWFPYSVKPLTWG